MNLFYIFILAPITNINFDGSTWIEPWTVLSLTVTCNGTGPFDKCIEIKSGEYKVTGNESCDHNYEKLDTCKFDINHYFLDRRNYTVVVILSNNIGTIAKPILINVVECKLHLLYYIAIFFLFNRKFQLY